MSVNVFKSVSDVSDRLTQLGLALAPLQEAVRQGYLARTRLTSNHPRVFFGYSMWAETVGALRDQLLASGWDKSDVGNYELTVNREGDLAIAVITGDEATGVSHINPSNKCPKGTNTAEAIATNNQLDMFAEQLPPAQEEGGFTTWVLLVHVAPDEVRAELSLPFEIDASGRIRKWKERIILPAIPRDDSSIEIRPPEAPDIDVPIKRRA